MLRLGGRGLAALLGVPGAGLLLAAPGHAQSSVPAERRFSLDYRAPAECPDGLSLVAAIQARTQGAALVAADVAPLRLTVQLLDDGRSKLQVDMPEGSFQRDYYASCSDAVASIALIAAMVLEAEPAKRESFVDRAPEPIAPPAAAFPVDDAPAASAELPASRPEPEPEQPKRASAPLRVAAQRATQASPVSWAVTAGGAVETAVAPAPPLGVTAGFEGWLDRTRWWAPGLQGGVFATASSTHNAADGEGKFQLFAGHLKVCALRLPVGESFRLLPCAVLEVGSYQARGGGEAVNVRSVTMPWLAGGALLRGQLGFSRALALEGTAGLKVLARRDTFVFRPTSLVYDLPRVSLGLGLGLLYRMP